MFFWQKNKVPFNPGSLKLEMHNHILPGVDDGTEDMEEAISLLRKLREAGYETVYITPHIYRDYFPNTAGELEEVYADLQSEVERHIPDLNTGLAAEYHYDDHFQHLVENEEELLCLPEQAILVEFPLLNEPDGWKETFFTLETRGYQPVLAHLERYGYMDRSDWEQLKQRDVIIQVNLLSLNGYYGNEYKGRALALLRHDLVDIWGTDIHRLGQWSAFEGFELPKSIAEKLEESTWLNQIWNESNS